MKTQRRQSILAARWVVISSDLRGRLRRRKRGSSRFDGALVALLEVSRDVVFEWCCSKSKIKPFGQISSPAHSDGTELTPFR